MADHLIELCRSALLKRLLPDGGFALMENGGFRPDGTAWAVLALKASGVEMSTIDKARERLKKEQEEDGRISIKKGFSTAYWPTPLCALAWQDSPACEEAHHRAINYLLSVTGKSHPEEYSGGHDTTLQGWSWIDGTHSWAEPTALGFLALKRYGMQQHRRAEEAIRLMMDRQLPRGGWNYGNTIVFNQELRPIPYATGLVLYALHGCVDRAEIQKSLDYLKKRIEKDRTPLSLGWEVMALCAWEKPEKFFGDYLMESWNLQEIYGSYNTSFLSLLILAQAFLLENERPL